MNIFKKYVYYDDNKTAKVISTTRFDVIKRESNDKIIETNTEINLNQIDISDRPDGLKLAYICNWEQHCGISTYSKFVLDKVKDRVNGYKIFSEYSTMGIESNDEISFCWKRGESLLKLVSEIRSYNPSVIMIQHEWGIFPNAAHFMLFITALKRLHVPIITVLHSVYDHQDKSIPMSILDNVIVHTESARTQLLNFKFKGNVYVIPHGCPDINTLPEVWNIFQNPYLLFGYGFGFKYKGVETAIDAIKYLKDSDPKFKDILYIYACSESANGKRIHENYYNILHKKVEENGLNDNIILLRGFLEPELLDTYLRTVKMVLFPYITDPNGVFGSSGAIKIAMSYNIPVIASKSNLFDDIDGYVKRTDGYIELAQEIDKIFSSEKYKQSVIDKSHEFIKLNTWDITADRYIDVLRKTVDQKGNSD